jgi:hypothetical protein
MDHCSQVADFKNPKPDPHVAAQPLNIPESVITKSNPENKVPDPKELPGTSSQEIKDIVKVPEDAPTITEALKICKEGGTIEIASGTYSEIISLTKSVSLISRSAAVFDDAGLGTSIVTARGPIEVKLQNIQIKNTQKTATTAIESSPPLVLIANGANVEFVGCVIEESVGDGVNLEDKAAATFSNCRLRKNRGYGINVGSASRVELSLSEIQDSGLSGIAAMNLGTMVTFGNGATVSNSSQNGVEVGNGAKFTGSGINIKNNKKIGLLVENGGSTAHLDSSCEISENQEYGIGVKDSGSVVAADATFENNRINGIFIESGGQADIQRSQFKSNGAIGIYLVNGSASSVNISQSSFNTHSDAGVAIVEGRGKVTDCDFTNNTTAIFYGEASSGSATGNSVYPGPVEQTIVTEKAGEVTLQGNTVKAAE